MPLEKDIENAFAKWCQGAKKLPCKKMKAENDNGFPDRTVFLPMGRTAYIEFKGKPGESLDPLQEAWFKRLKVLGHRVLCTSDLAEAKEFIEGML